VDGLPGIESDSLGYVSKSLVLAQESAIRFEHGLEEAPLRTHASGIELVAVRAPLLVPVVVVFGEMIQWRGGGCRRSAGVHTSGVRVSALIRLVGLPVVVRCTFVLFWRAGTPSESSLVHALTYYCWSSAPIREVGIEAGDAVA
jgi:hypothetical protein